MLTEVIYVMYKNKILYYFLIAVVISVVSYNLCFGIVECPVPNIPPPKEVSWNKIKPYPYTMVIKSKKFGNFNFTKEAEQSLNKYKVMCKTMGLRKEIIDKIEVRYPKKGFIEIKCANPLFKTIVELKSKERRIEIDYPYEDYIIRVIIDPEEKYKSLTAECITKYSMEIPAVALVNTKKEVVDLIYPPSENIFLLDIDIDRICEYNYENKYLVEELKNPFLNPDQKDDIIQRIIANAIYHPLGKFCLGKKNNQITLLAEVLNQRLFLPIECVNIPLHNLIQKNSLIRYFSKEDITNLSDNKILELIYKITKNYPQGEFVVIEDFPLRKDWYIITTPNTCLWTDYFMNYIEIESKNMVIESKIPIHLHPWQELKWLLRTTEEYWFSEYQIYLLPSGRDIEFFKLRYPDSNVYIIVGKDPYSEELNWAVYDDISVIEKDMEKLELSNGDTNQIKAVLADIKNTRGAVQRYYSKKGKGIIVDEEIDSLLTINRRQIVLMSEIEDYRKEYPWRLLNTSFFIPILNEQLAKRGWKIVPGKNELTEYDITKKEFYYEKDITARMDLFLFILFKLCYIEADDLSIGIKREAEIMESLRNICSQLDYLSVKYYHLKGFAKHMEYISNIIRFNVWNREKAFLIAKEQINNGRYYLERYNLGYYKDISKEKIMLISSTSSPRENGVIDIEGIIKKLSRKQNIKNVEEFAMELEKQLVLHILRMIGK